jgi:hypothetical protein
MHVDGTADHLFRNPIHVVVPERHASLKEHDPGHAISRSISARPAGQVAESAIRERDERVRNLDRPACGQQEGRR